MMNDYKICSLRFGNPVEVKYCIYEGDITTENEMNPDTMEEESVTRYRRSSVVEMRQQSFPAGTTKEQVITALDAELESEFTPISS